MTRDGLISIRDIKEYPVANAFTPPNATLIAATPKLLNACQEALAWFDPEMDGLSSREMLQWEKEVREILTEAIKETEAQ